MSDMLGDMTESIISQDPLEDDDTDLYSILRYADYQGNVTDEDCLNRADAIIAAGWRLVPDDAVVVSREDVRIVTSVMDGVPLEPSPKRYADAMDRLYAALESADA